jgi:4-amino-4-deoxychorismate lyase
MATQDTAAMGCTDCWIDGEPCGLVPVSDRGLQYGDGLFETIACRDGAPRFMALHLARLAHGCERLAIELPAADTLRFEIGRAATDTERCLVKLIVTRGSSAQRGYAPPADAIPRRIVQRFPWPQEPLHAEQGVAVSLSTITLAASPWLAGLKHLNRLENVLARRQLDASRHAEALLCTADGDVIGGSMSNIFSVQGTELTTPRLDQCGVAGVMRAVVLREARTLGLRVRQDVLRLPDLDAAAEIFLTNARIGLWPVTSLGAWQRPVGPVTRQLQARIAALTD